MKKYLTWCILALTLSFSIIDARGGMGGGGHFAGGGHMSGRNKKMIGVRKKAIKKTKQRKNLNKSHTVDQEKMGMHTPTTHQNHINHAKLDHAENNHPQATQDAKKALHKQNSTQHHTNSDHPNHLNNRDLDNNHSFSNVTFNGNHPSENWAPGTAVAAGALTAGVIGAANNNAAANAAAANTAAMNAQLMNTELMNNANLGNNNANAAGAIPVVETVISPEHPSLVKNPELVIEKPIVQPSSTLVEPSSEIVSETTTNTETIVEKKDSSGTTTGMNNSQAPKTEIQNASDNKDSVQTTMPVDVATTGEKVDINPVQEAATPMQQPGVSRN